MKLYIITILLLSQTLLCYSQGSGKEPAKNSTIIDNRSDTGNKFVPGSPLPLDHIYFLIDRHQFKPESKATLDKLYSILVANPSLKISIEGHVCCITKDKDAFDEDTYKPGLSVNRAMAVYDYLIEKGIDSARLQYAGFGRTRPIIANEKTNEDAAKNGRVEIIVTGNK